MLAIKDNKLGAVLRSLKTKEGRREFYQKNKPMVLYVLFGVGTTIISLGSYYLFRVLFPDADSVPEWFSWIFKITAKLNIESNTVFPVLASWVLANLFSFFITRTTVFGSKTRNFWKIMFELAKFFAARIATLIVDMVIMFLLVDLPGISGGLYEFAAKIFSNIVVLILNYILSRIFVFRKKKKHQKPIADPTADPPANLNADRPADLTESQPENGTN